MAFTLRKILYLTVTICWILSLVTKQALANKEESFKAPADIEADIMQYDNNTSTVSASGNVFITQGTRKLQANKVSYNQEHDLFAATGNVILTQPDKTVITADTANFYKQLEKGNGTNLTYTFIDKSTAWAKKGTIIDKDHYEYKSANFTSCLICKGAKKITPLWQIVSRRTYVDQIEQRIYHTNSFFEVYGIPIAYTPYFSHPTPGADSKTGFLLPKYKNSSLLGTTISTPFYYNIAPDKGLTITPTYTSKAGNIFSGQYRQLTKTGRFTLSGNFVESPTTFNETTSTKVPKYRGEFSGKGNFILNDTWSWGFYGDRVSDNAYILKYFNRPDDNLVSTDFADYIKDNNSFHAETVSFQDLESARNTRNIPTVLPHLTNNWRSSPDEKGRYFGIDSDILSITRKDSFNTQRFSTNGYWNIPYITDNGNVFSLKNSLRADIYNTNKLPNPANQNDTSSSAQGRFIPETKLDWSYPLVATKENYRIFVKPLANAIVSPYNQNPKKIPNEDSQGITFSDLNLFESSHFTGLDLVEGGPRTNYGIETSIDHDQYGYTSALVGQSYKAKENVQFDENSGLREKNSDLVGRLSQNYKGILDITYSFRLDNKTLAANTNSVTASYNKAPLGLNVTYLSTKEAFDNNSIRDTSKRQTAIYGGHYDINEQWTVQSNANRDLEAQRWTSTASALVYKGQCISIMFSVNQSFIKNGDATSNNTFSIQVALKNLTKPLK